jgi:alkaline phosphatase D
MKYLFLCALPFLMACRTSLPNENSSHNIQTATFAQEQIAAVTTDKSVTQFAFGSCEHQKQAQPIWETILKDSPDFYISMGDTVYASKPEDQPISEQYRLQSQVPEFKRFRAQIPILATWDDNDVGQGDGGFDNPKKDEAKQEYQKFFPYTKAVIPEKQGGIYHSMVFGKAPHRVQVILLDTRYFRSSLEKNPNPSSPIDIYKPSKDLSKTMLGDQQWQWFEQQLKVPAEVRFIVSSIQLIPEQHGFEKWANFPHERKRFLDLLRKTKAKNTVILSGDRHHSEFSQIKLPGLGEVNEFTSSGINRVSTLQGEPNRYRVGSVYSQVNFGMARIDWDRKDIALEIRGLNNELIQELHQKLK